MFFSRAKPTKAKKPTKKELSETEKLKEESKELKDELKFIKERIKKLESWLTRFSKIFDVIMINNCYFGGI